MVSSQESRVKGTLQLVDGLAKHVKSDSKARYERIRQNAIAAARSTTHLRTNQFEVRDQLAGLQEKAEVFGRHDIAEALDGAVRRANAIESKWMPECLSLLLQISDRPIDNTNLNDLEDLRPSDTTKSLTWDEILKDALREDKDGIWDTIDYDAESSLDGDEIGFVHSEIDSGSLPESDTEDTEDQENLPIDADVTAAVLEPVEQWRSKMEIYQRDSTNSVLSIPEAHILREVLFMLHGSPTDLFYLSDGLWSPRTGLEVEGLSEVALCSILKQCASLGVQLEHLRSWSTRSATEPIEQSFLSALSQAIHTFDSSLLAIEHDILSPDSSPNTLLKFMPQVRGAVQSLMIFSKMLKKVETQPTSEFVYLDILYQELCHQHTVGNQTVFADTLNAFKQCLQTYLSPIAIWLFEGKLPREGLSFLRRKTDEDLNPTTTFWSDDYTIVLSADGQPAAPEFLQPLVSKIVSVGKTIVFLEFLGDSQPPHAKDRLHLPDLTDEVAKSSVMTPFEKVLESALNRWVESSQSRLKRSLGSVLHSQGGLRDALIAFEHVYFSRDGTCFDEVATCLVERWKGNKQALTNPYILTAIYQNAWSSSENVKPDLIRVRSVQTRDESSSRTDIMAQLNAIEVFYTLSWPLANIIRADVQAQYRRIHAFLMQLRVAKHEVDQVFGRLALPHGAHYSRGHKLVLSLQHRLRWFLNTFSTYLFGIVLPTTHEQLHETATDIGDLDELIDSHSTAIENLLRCCFLREKDASTHKALTSMMRLSLMFSSTVPDARPSSPDVVEPSDGQLDEAKLQTFLETYNKLVGFIYAGVLETSRTDGNRHLETLAQELSPDMLTRSP